MALSYHVGGVLATVAEKLSGSMKSLLYFGQMRQVLESPTWSLGQCLRGNRVYIYSTFILWTTVPIRGLPLASKPKHRQTCLWNIRSLMPLVWTNTKSHWYVFLSFKRGLWLPFEQLLWKPALSNFFLTEKYLQESIHIPHSECKLWLNLQKLSFRQELCWFPYIKSHIFINNHYK